MSNGHTNTPNENGTKATLQHFEKSIDAIQGDIKSIWKELNDRRVVTAQLVATLNTLRVIILTVCGSGFVLYALEKFSP